MAKTYDPKQIIVTFGGIIAQGFADGTFLSVSFNEDQFALTVGADGEGARAKSNNNSARIELTLMQTSITNDLLSAVRRADASLPGRAGVLPLQIRDVLGTTLYEAMDCWIVKSPDVEFSKEISERTWILETDYLFDFVGGNLV